MAKVGFIDDFFPPFIDSTKDTSFDERLEFHSFPKKIYFSIKTLNQIIEDYATARHIYFQAESDKLELLDSFSVYRSTLDYCRNSIKYGYLKTAFVKLYNIFDKIAHVLFHYYEIKQSNIYFSHLLDSPFVNLIISTNNRSLLALNNLAWDFEPNGIYYHLKKLRHFLTHDFIDIKEDMFNRRNAEREFSEYHHLTKELLCAHLDELIILVKAGIMYFVQALENEIKKIKKESSEKLLELEVMSQDYIFGKNNTDD
jgi:hypothetical protein